MTVLLSSPQPDLPFLFCQIVKHRHTFLTQRNNVIIQEVTMKNKCRVQKFLFLLMAGLFFFLVKKTGIAAGTGPGDQDHDPAQTGLGVKYKMLR